MMNDPFTTNRPTAIPACRGGFACYVPFDPAARNVPLGGKTKLTQSLISTTTILTLASLVLNGGFATFNDNPMLGPSIDTVISFGGMTQTLVRQGQWWRIPWASLLHAGLIHLLMNLSALFGLGYLLEPDWGFRRTTFIFIVAALSGNLLSVTLDPINVSVGSSGGIFGLMAGLPIYVLEFWTTIPQSKVMLCLTTGSLLLTIATSFLPMVDVYAHLGGCAGGLLATLATLAKLEAPMCRKRTKNAAEIVELSQTRRCKLIHAETSETDVDEHSAALLNTQMALANEEGRERQEGSTKEQAELPSPGRLREVFVHNRTPVSTQRHHRTDLSPQDASSGPLRLRRTVTATRQAFRPVTNRQESMLNVEKVQQRRCNMPAQPSHFLLQPPGALQMSMTVSGPRLVLNSSATRLSIRRTRELLNKSPTYFYSRDKLVWTIRILALLLLISMWSILVYYLWICPGCYNPPGQILQMKELRNGRKLNTNRRPLLLI